MGLYIVFQGTHLDLCFVCGTREDKCDTAQSSDCEIMDPCMSQCSLAEPRQQLDNMIVKLTLEFSQCKAEELLVLTEISTAAEAWGPAPPTI